MTIREIKRRLAPAKPVSTASLYRYLGRLKIRPLAVRQRPQHYPADTPDKILAHLGLDAGNGGGRLVTMGQLRTERKKARAK